jgi:hypothetical protein
MSKKLNSPEENCAQVGFKMLKQKQKNEMRGLS